MRDWKVPPQDFWRMTAEEWFWLYNAHQPPGTTRLTDEEREACLATLNGE